MQVFGLPRRITRTARAASRLLDAKSPNIEAARRRDAVARWLAARGHGLSSARAAQAVGVAASTLRRWRASPEPKSRRPRRVRKPMWTPQIAAAVERLRLDHPMWGKLKLAPVLRAQGFAVSEATVGRILQGLVRRGRVAKVKDLIRKIAARKAPAKRPHAVRKPSHVTFNAPGDIVQIDTMSVAIAPGVSIKHFDAYDPFAKWTVAKPYRRATAKNAADFLGKVLAEMPDPVKAVQIDGGS